MEIEELLRRASAAPLGPLAFSFTPLSASKWALLVTLRGRSQQIQAERDTASDGLILSSAVDGDATAWNDAWVTDIVRESEGEKVRLWLHGDGLSPALLLNALAALVPAPVQEPGPAVEAVTEMPKISIPLPPPPDRPPPVPVERPRPVGWNSFGRIDMQEPGPDASASAVSEATSVSEPQIAASDASEADSEAEAPDASLANAEAEAPVPVVAAAEPAAATADSVPGPAGASGYCRECGSPYESDHAFCTNCGAKLN